MSTGSGPERLPTRFKAVIHDAGVAMKVAVLEEGPQQHGKAGVLAPRYPWVMVQVYTNEGVVSLREVGEPHERAPALDWLVPL